MTEEVKKQLIMTQYGELQRYDHKKNFQIYYNLIKMKYKWRLVDLNQSLYLDVKKFVQAYITASDSQDYGYDEINITKITDVCSYLEDEQQLAILYLTRRLFYTRGYDQDIIYSEIVKVDKRVSFANRQYWRWLRLLLSQNFTRLLIVYILYVLLIFIVLLPAPFEWMGCFDVQFKDYCENSILNHVANGLGVLSGSDSISPEITPNCFWGMLLYCIGLVVFYFMFANFILKKIEDYITLKQ